VGVIESDAKWHLRCPYALRSLSDWKAHYIATFDIIERLLTSLSGNLCSEAASVSKSSSAFGMNKFVMYEAVGTS